MEVLSNTPLTLSEILNESSMLDLSIDDANAIELELLPEKLDDSDDENYAIIQIFFNKHPYFRGLGSEYYDFDLLTDTRRESLSKYLKWLINSINSWSGDKPNSKFSALCQLIRVFNWGDDFWGLLKSKGFQNDKWLDTCCQVLQATTPQVQPARFSQNPISFENENKIFMSSEKERDWDGVARFLNSSELNYYPPILKESLRCLYTLDFHKLIEICNSVDTALVALVYPPLAG
ncbi:hypothetical protein [Vibrio vulnificus]|uniref:hypothetical protein n=1 Tax=Vibrio vulnificus TaxID=672 RepID=UPI00102ADEA9|nr:hypothetical protein [Vibrio vulnificus]RZR42781.1 hypothetical protein D8T58_18375 [Vibrio vulnificus]